MTEPPTYGKELRSVEKLRRWAAVAAIVFSIVVILLSARRIVRTHQTPGPFNSDAQGFCDFQNGVYFPSQAFVDGVSPYSESYATNYPVPRSAPFYSPVVFALHVVFAMLPMQTAEILYFGWLIVLVGSIAFLITRWIVAELSSNSANRLSKHDLNAFRFDIFALVVLSLVASRGGQQTIYTGYFTFELILATLVAVHYGRGKPWLSGLALVVVSCKPNYVLPIGLLMLCRGNLKSIVIGGVLSVALAVACFAWIMPEGGWTELAEQIAQTQEIHRADPIERPVNTWIRVDLLAIVAKWLSWDPTERDYLLGMLAIVLPTGWLLWKRQRSFPSDQEGVINWTGALLLLSSIVSVYHHVFDAVLLLPVVGTCLLWAWQAWISPRRQASPSDIGKYGCLLLAALIAFPQLNYFSSQMLLKRLQLTDWSYQLVTSLNGIALFTAWAIVFANLLRAKKLE